MMTAQKIDADLQKQSVKMFKLIIFRCSLFSFHNSVQFNILLLTAFAAPFNAAPFSPKVFKSIKGNPIIVTESYMLSYL